MKTKIILSLLLFIGLGAYSQNNFVQLSGKIKDKTTNEALVGVTILVKNTTDGTQTDVNGKFVLKTSYKFPLLLVVSYVGYEKQEFLVESEKSNFSFEIKPQVLLASEVVVSASRVEENILKSPVAIDKIDIIAIRETPAPTFYDAIENVKGVQMTTSSINFKVPNTRGFNSPNNFRFMQLVDGVDIQAPTLGVSIGNAAGPNELDIKSVEIIPGSSSALYGINSINGLSNLQTKNPYLNKGVGVYQRLAVNHVDGKDHALSFLTETAFRVAGTVDKKDRFAYKLNASYFQGVDWVSSNETDQNTYDLKSSNPSFPEFDNAQNNPAYDAWNRYGDERNNNIPITVNYQGHSQTFNVRRTGYWEKDLVSPTVKNAKVDAGVFYKLNDKTQVSYVYRYGTMDGIFQRGNKIQLKDLVLQSHAVEFKNQKLIVRAYANSENTGNSYNLKPLSDNLDLSFRSNNDWKTIYKNTLQNAINSGVDIVTANQLAREQADAGRPEPGSPAFNELVSTITGINNWDHASVVPGAPVTGGAALWQKSKMYHGEFQYDLTSLTDSTINILIGADARRYVVIPDGNNFVDFSKPLADRTEAGGKNVFYDKVGGFVQLTKELFAKKLKLIGSLRYDKNFDFEGKFNPRVAIVFSPNKINSIRVSYQNGYRFPALFEALSFVNNGNVRRVGGLAKVNEGLGFLENSYTQTSIDAFNAAVTADVATGLTKPQAIIKNKDVLVIANLQTLKPEEINAFDAGYKSVLADNKVVIDWDVYFNILKGFLGQIEVAVPKTDIVGTDSAAFDMTDRAKQTRYRVYTNATNTYYGYGSSLRLSYNFYKTYSISTNVNYNQFKAKEDNDIFVTGYNTPDWSLNVQLGNRELFNNFGFNVVWKWQNSFLWQSPLANGNVPSYNTFDAQVSYKLPKIKTIVKVGASNLLNSRYIQYAGGPTTGGLYYVSLTFDAGFKN